MTFSLLAYAAALFGGAMAFLVGRSEQPSFARRVFVIGMILLTFESIFSGLSLSDTTGDEFVPFLNWSLLCMALLPAIWLLFSLSYGRGNYRDFLRKWRPVLGVAFLLPVGIALWSRAKIRPAIGPLPPALRSSPFVYGFWWARFWC